MVVDIPDVVTYTNFGDHRLRGFWVAGGVKFPPSHWLSSSPLQHSRTTVRVCDTNPRTDSHLAGCVVQTGELSMSTIAQITFTVGAGEAITTRAAVATVTVVVTRRTVTTRTVWWTHVEIYQSAPSHRAPTSQEQWDCTHRNDLCCKDREFVAYRFKSSWKFVNFTNY